jgi:hypothetical protein
MNDPANDPLLARLIELQHRIETLGQLAEQLECIIEQQFAMMRAMLAGEAPPPPPPRVN